MHTCTPSTTGETAQPNQQAPSPRDRQLSWGSALQVHLSQAYLPVVFSIFPFTIRRCSEHSYICTFFSLSFLFFFFFPSPSPSTSPPPPLSPSPTIEWVTIWGNHLLAHECTHMHNTGREERERERERKRKRECTHTHACMQTNKLRKTLTKTTKALKPLACDPSTLNVGASGPGVEGQLCGHSWLRASLWAVWDPVSKIDDDDDDKSRNQVLLFFFPFINISTSLKFPYNWLITFIPSSPLRPTHSFPISNSMSFFFKYITHQVQLTLPIYYPMGCGTLHQSVVDLPGSTPLKKNGSPRPQKP